MKRRDAARDSGSQARTDAARNREQLLAAAAVTFRNEGPRVTMQKIAQNAGVGVGTLYRNFPDRTALLAELQRRAYKVVLDLAKTSRLGLNDDPLQTLLAFLLGVIEHRDTLVLPFMGAPVDTLESADRSTREIYAELEQILERGRQQGTVRPDANALDVMIMGAYLARPLPNLPNELGAARRQALIFIGGLRLTGQPLGEQATTLSDLDRAWHSKPT